MLRKTQQPAATDVRMSQLPSKRQGPAWVGYQGKNKSSCNSMQNMANNFRRSRADKWSRRPVDFHEQTRDDDGISEEFDPFLFARIGFFFQGNLHWFYIILYFLSIYKLINKIHLIDYLDSMFCFIFSKKDFSRHSLGPPKAIQNAWNVLRFAALLVGT